MVLSYEAVTLKPQGEVDCKLRRKLPSVVGAQDGIIGFWRELPHVQGARNDGCNKGSLDRGMLRVMIWLWHSICYMRHFTGNLIV